MSTPDDTGMSYGCQYGCGNPYHVILIQVQDNSSLFLCLPCFVRTADEIVKAITTGDAPGTETEQAELDAMRRDQVPGPRAKRGRHNAPSGTDDPDLVEAFDSRIYEDELPDEFR